MCCPLFKHQRPTHLPLPAQHRPKLATPGLIFKRVVEERDVQVIVTMELAAYDQLLLQRGWQ